MRNINLEPEFSGRTAALYSISRYKLHSEMFFRTSVGFHADRLSALVENAADAVRPQLPTLSLEKAIGMALVHDDPELHTDDVPRSVKKSMTQAERETLYYAELDAIESLSMRWPNLVNGYNYKNLMREAKDKETAEAQLVSYLDKIDGYCEALHELYSGNKTFLDAAIEYIPDINRLKEIWRKLALLFVSGHPLFTPLRTVESVRKINYDYPKPLVSPDGELTPSGDDIYDQWRKITVANFGLEALVRRRE